MNAYELGNLLWQLVRGDLAARHQAAQALAPLKFEAMEGNPEVFMGDWPAQIQAAITAPGFGTRAWILALMGTMETGQRERMAAFHEDRRLEKAETALLESQLKRETGERQLKKLAKQLRERSGFNPQKTGSRAELELVQKQWLDVQVEAGIIYRCLGDLVLEAEDKLRNWLAGESKFQRRAAESLEELGPKAAGFAPALLDKLDRAELKSEFWGVLAQVARGDGEMIRGLMFRVAHAPAPIAVAALQVLRIIGPHVVHFMPDAIPITLDATRNPQTQIAAVYALGSVGNGSVEHETAIVTRLLELSRMSDVWLKGATIWALGDLGARPDLAVPRLIAAFEDYDEPDPDYNYGSSHYFVTKSLEQFGPRAAPAVPALLRHIETESEGLDRGVLSALRAIGSAALPWLDEIDELARVWRDEDLDPEDNPLDEILKDIVAGEQ